jgi:hypothetical protein
LGERHRTFENGQNEGHALLDIQNVDSRPCQNDQCVIHRQTTTPPCPELPGRKLTVKDALDLRVIMLLLNVSRMK